MKLDTGQRAAGDEGQGGICWTGKLGQGGENRRRDPWYWRGALWAGDVIEGEGVKVGSLGEEVDDRGVEGKGRGEVAETGVGDGGVRDCGTEDGGGTGREREFERLEPGHVCKGLCKGRVERSEDGGAWLHSDMERADAAGEVGVSGEEKDDEGVLCGWAKRDGAVEMALSNGEECGRGAGEDEEVGGGEAGEYIVEELEGEGHSCVAMAGGVERDL